MATFKLVPPNPEVTAMSCGAGKFDRVGKSFTVGEDGLFEVDEPYVQNMLYAGCKIARVALTKAPEKIPLEPKG